MRLTFFPVAFLFINALATPINPSRGDAVALRMISDRTSIWLYNGHWKQLSAAKCKRATASELIASLITVDEENPLQEEEDCSVYHLTKTVDNEKVILKVIQDGPRIVEREAWANHNVKQLLGWRHTPDKTLYYLFLKNMGVPLSQVTELVNDRDHVQKLMRQAEEFYSTQYHLEHDDHDLERPKNWAFRQVGGSWRAKLIDWEFFIKESGYQGYSDPPKPFEIDPNCVFVPSKMRKWVTLYR